MANRCEVASGTLWDPYTATTIRFEKGGSTSGEPELDHLVALSDAWQKGAQQLPYEQRINLANDPLNLILVDGSSNGSKSDQDVASWLPPNKAFRCTLVARVIAVKKKYAGLWATAAEKDAMARVLSACPDMPLPTGGHSRLDPQGRPAPGSTLPAEAGTAPAAPPPAPAPAGGTDPDYGTCAKAKEAGKGPYTRGQDPEYDYYRDGDADGTVCE